MVKTNELLEVLNLLPEDHILVDTAESGTARIPYNVLRCSGAAAHNEHYRGKNIQDKYENGSLFTAIEDGSFRDLFIGDYFDITISTSYTASENVRCLLAGFDIYWGCGDTPLHRHHAVIVPMNAFAATAKMNDTNDTTGAYNGSAMATTVLPAYANALANVFGTRLITNRELLTKGTTPTVPSMAGMGWNGASSEWAWFDCKLRLLSEPEVYGGTVFSSSAFDVGIAKTQLPLFRLNPARIVCGLGGSGYTSETTRCAWWLSAVVSATFFAVVDGSGYASYGSASYSFGVRPRFLIS